MSAYYLGKNANAPISRRGLGMDMDDISELYGGFERGQGGKRGRRPGRGLPGQREISIETPAFPERIERPERPAPVVEAQGESYVDELMASLFGKGFETIRGIGGRGRESVYDLLARQGLLGTGAATDVSKEMAWQTERGITDLIREMGEMRAGKEQEALNMLMTYLGMTSQSWG